MNLGTQLQGIAGGMIAAYGDDITVNGQATKAFFNKAPVERVQTELKEDEWNTPCYEVELPAAVLGAPWNLKTDSVIEWNKHGWTMKVRHLPDTPGLNNADVTIDVLAVLFTQG